MKYSAQFKGLESQDTYPLDSVVYRDTNGGLLQVDHNMDVLRQKSSEEWKRLFEDRAASRTLPYSSGIWSKKEWILPEIPDEHIVSLNEGWTSLLKPPQFNKALGTEMWIKLCGNGHTGSFKDLGMTVLVSQVNHMIRRGIPINAVACASTGDTSAALSAYCAYAGIPSIVFLPKGKISTAQLIQPISNGAIVLALDTDFDGCMRVVQEVTEDKGIYLANSMNPLRIEGQKSISMEICQQFGWDVPDTIIIPGGNLGNVSALGAGFEMMLELGLINKRPRIVVAQAALANPLYLSFLKGFEEYSPMQAGDTQASAIRIGAPVSYKRAVKTLKNFSGLVVQVDEDALANAAHLADRSGLYCCPQTGVALGALIQLREEKKIEKDEKVVVISTAHGLKFSEFKVGYHEQKLKDVQSKFANPIITCEPDAGKIRDILSKKM